jgi:AcrR family transcriptional regulator
VPPPPISRDQVLRAALAIVDLEGVEALSMRRLGRALGRDPMAVYRYAETKTALLDGVVELVLSELTVDATDEDWQSQLREVARRFRAIAISHPHVVPCS